MTVANIDEAQLWIWIGEIPDPEIPILSLTDLGIIRYIRIEPNSVKVGLAPTYSGCPATEVIEESVVQTLQEHGITNAKVERVLAPPWSSDWVSEAGRQKLQEYGISPPLQGALSKHSQCTPDWPIECPRCHSSSTQKVSEFGSTPCKALYKCRCCLEPFEHFKCI